MVYEVHQPYNCFIFLRTMAFKKYMKLVFICSLLSSEFPSARIINTKPKFRARASVSCKKAYVVQKLYNEKIHTLYMFLNCNVFLTPRSLDRYLSTCKSVIIILWPFRPGVIRSNTILI